MNARPVPPQAAAALRVVPQQAAFAIRMLLTRLALQEAIGISLGERNANNHHSER